MGTLIGIGKSPMIQQGALLNPEPPIPDGALQFEESLEYIFFEGDLTEEHITFET